MVSKDLPLISVVVISYNSAFTIEETLQSIYVQSYENIELIISDDCSCDSTLEICRHFVKDNEARFVNVSICSSEKNTGISVNCNRGCSLAKGEWVKIIAADDILLPNCITSFYKHALKFPNDYFFFSNIELFGEKVDQNIIDIWGQRLRLFDVYTTARQQNDYLTLRWNYVPAATSFMNLRIFRMLGGFDESLLFIEDHPFWIIVTGAGYRLSYLPEVLVRYRISTGSISIEMGPNDIYRITKKLFKQKYKYKNPIFPLLINHIDQFGNNNNKNRFLLLLLTVVGLPFRLYQNIKVTLKRY